MLHSLRSKGHATQGLLRRGCRALAPACGASAGPAAFGRSSPARSQHLSLLADAPAPPRHARAQEATMPPVPAHRLSWQGSPVMVDIHGQQQPRMRVSSHTNEYVGSLRSKIARLCQGASPKRVRLFHSGARGGAPAQRCPPAALAASTALPWRCFTRGLPRPACCAQKPPCGCQASPPPCRPARPLFPQARSWLTTPSPSASWTSAPPATC